MSLYSADTLYEFMCGIILVYILHLYYVFFCKEHLGQVCWICFFPATDSKVVRGSECCLAAASNGKKEPTWMIAALAMNNI